MLSHVLLRVPDDVQVKFKNLNCLKTSKITILESHKLHISLSKPFKISVSESSSLINELEKVTRLIRPITIGINLDNSNYQTVLYNSDLTTKYIGLKVVIGKGKLELLSNKINKILSKYSGKETFNVFYPHVSVGYQKSKLVSNSLVNYPSSDSELEETVESTSTANNVVFQVDKVFIKIGNQSFPITLGRTESNLK